MPGGDHRAVLEVNASERTLDIDRGSAVEVAGLDDRCLHAQRIAVGPAQLHLALRSARTHGTDLLQRGLRAVHGHKLLGRELVGLAYLTKDRQRVQTEERLEIRLVQVHVAVRDADDDPCRVHQALETIPDLSGDLVDEYRGVQRHLRPAWAAVTRRRCAAAE
ncbi:hypothetical protein SDC9_174283 [bioreactor metagenome]|uniref:Uncharacterized protein n=1 Tax=bioreactor metagenome TaxID=1076179 RepID=A0A645GIY4_9ZZZZ